MKLSVHSLAAIAALFVAGCSDRQHDQDLRTFVKESENLLPRGRIPPLPEPRSSDPRQLFDAFQLADPFQPRAQPPKADEFARRARSLLARYATSEDIDAARNRARRNLEAAIKSGEFRSARIRGEQENVRQMIAGFKDGKQPPMELAAELKDYEARLRAAEKELAAWTRELATLDVRFDADKRRFLELARRKQLSPPR